MFSIVTLMHMIPNVPSNIMSQIEREKFITQKALWQVEIDSKPRTVFNIGVKTPSDKNLEELEAVERARCIPGDNDALLNNYE